MELRTREHLTGRPEPDEAELEPVRLSTRDLLSAAKRAAKRMLDDNMMLIASALAYSVFFAIPAVLLVAFPLMPGPQTEKRLGSALGHSSLVAYLWWIAQWPILIFGLLAAFAAILYLGPNVASEKRHWKLITPGAVVAVVAWLAVSGLFAVYTAKFGSYNKTWGSLSAVIVMLTWLWLSSLALLFGAELNAEIEENQERRGALPART